MKVLVTGAGGFVGPHLVRELAAAGHHPVPTDRNNVDGVTHAVDLLEPDEVEWLLDDTSPEAVVHLAGWSHVGRSWNDPTLVYRLNVEATLRLYTEFSRRQSEGRFLYVSSAAVYGTPPPDCLPLTESSPIHPDSPYALSRYAAEQALTMLAPRAAPLLIARPFNHIGRGQSPDFACPAFARRVVDVRDGRAASVRHGNLTARRDFLHVSDVVRAYRLILEAGETVTPYVIASGEARSMEEILRALFRLAGIAPALEHDPALERPTDAPELRGDSTLLRQAVGWEPLKSWDAALMELLQEADAANIGAPA